MKLRIVLILLILGSLGTAGWLLVDRFVLKRGATPREPKTPTVTTTPVHPPEVNLPPGAYNVRVADLDNDGDLDIVASTLLRWDIDVLAKDDFKDSAGGIRKKLDSVILLEQTAPGKFQPYSLETDDVIHPALAIGDYDDDGDLDILVGTFLYTHPRPAITLFENRGK